METPLLTADFTAKTAGNSSYKSTWTYGDFTMVNAANNSKSWAYMKFGGKSADIGTYNPCYVVSPKVSEVIASIDVVTNAGNLTVGSVNEWGVYVYSDAEMTDEIDHVTGGTMTAKTAETLTLKPTSPATSWPANSYYKVYFDLANTSSTNGIVWVDKINWYKLPTPSVAVVDNDTRDTLTSIDFGNIGQRFQKVFVYGLSCANMEAGSLTIALTGTDADKFSLGEASVTVSAGSNAISYLIVRQNTQTVGDYSATLRITGGGLESAVEVPITMSVKAPEITTSTDEIDFGDLKQGDQGVFSEARSVTLTGKYLSSGIHIAAYGAMFDVAEHDGTSNIYPDEDGEINATIDVTAAIGWTGSQSSYLIVSSLSSPVSEFANISNLVNFSSNITQAYKVNVQVFGNNAEALKLTAEGNESDEYGKLAVWVDGNGVYINAENKPGYAFASWSTSDAGITIANTTSSTTKITATAAGTVTANYGQVCTPLPAPKLYWDPEVTYNSATIRWESVHDATEYRLFVYEKETDLIVFSDDVAGEDAAESSKTYTVTGLSGETDYYFTVMAISHESSYCEYDNEVTSNKEFTTAENPAATLTLSENGVERLLAGSHKLNDVVTLPTEVATEVTNKVLVGWSSETIVPAVDVEPGPATYWSAGADYTIQSTADKLYAVYATKTQAKIDTTVIFDATLNGSSGDDVVTSGYSISKDASAKSGYYQDKSSGTMWIKVKSDNNSKIIPDTRKSILVTAKIGGSNAKDLLTNAVGVVLIDNDDFEVCSEQTLTTKVEAQTGTEYTISMPVENSGNVRGVNVWHEKETSYNVRIYGLRLAYTTGGEISYSGYTTSGPRKLANPVIAGVTDGETYKVAQSVTITAAEGTIYYTTDGTEPTAESTEYTGAIAISTRGETTIKAIAIDGVNQSDIVSATINLNLPFASFEELVEAGLDENVSDITVSFADAEIAEFKANRKNVVINVKDENDANIQIYCSAAACDANWIEGGKISGTAINGDWKTFSGAREFVITSWTGITYTKPAPEIAWPVTEAKAYTAGKVYELPVLTNPNELTISYSSNTPAVASVVANEIQINGAGEAVITASFAGNDTYAAKEVSYTLHVYAPAALVVSGPAAKTEYEAGEIFDHTGMVATVTYGDGQTWVATDVVTWSYSLEPITASTDGIDVTATWEAQSKTSLAFKQSITVKKHAVTFSSPANGTLVVKNGDDAIASGDAFANGTTLTIVTTPADNYELATLTAGGVDVKEAKTFTVGTEDIVVAATFIKLQNGELTFNKSVVDFGEVQLGTTSVETQVLNVTGSKLTSNSEVTISIDGTDGYFAIITPATGKLAANAEGVISGTVNIAVTDEALASAGVKTATLRFHSSDLTADSIVTLQLTVAAPEDLLLGLDLSSYEFEINAGEALPKPSVEAHYSLSGNIDVTADAIFDDAAFNNAIAGTYTINVSYNDGNGQHAEATYTVKVKDTATAIGNAEMGEKAVKVIENNQLIIIKNGVKYTISGSKIR